MVVAKWPPWVQSPTSLSLCEQYRVLLTYIFYLSIIFDNKCDQKEFLPHLATFDFSCMEEIEVDNVYN